MPESEEILSRTARPADRTLHYGPEPAHVADVWLPPDLSGWPGPGSASFAGAPLVVVVHGGFWRAEWDRTHCAPLAEDLAARGYAVAVIEYRRVGMEGGGWPGTFDDVRTALDSVAGLVAEATGGAVDPERPVALGHSAGGQLVLLAAGSTKLAGSAKLAGVVALAPVADLAAAYARGIGAVAEFLGGDPHAVPQAYAEATPGPPAVPVTVVHGLDDQIVPVELSRPYAAQDGVSTVELSGVGHYALIDPKAPAWEAVVSALAALRPPLQ